MTIILQKEKIYPSGNVHVIDTYLSRRLGTLEAAILNHFVYWITYNKKTKKNFHDGKTWTYHTLDDLCVHFDYASKSQIFDAIDMLCLGIRRKGKDKGTEFQPILLKGNYNKRNFDRTIWYAFVEEDQWIKNSSYKKNMNDDDKEEEKISNNFAHIVNLQNADSCYDIDRETASNLHSDVIKSDLPYWKLTTPIPEDSYYITTTTTNDNACDKQSSLPAVVASSENTSNGSSGNDSSKAKEEISIPSEKTATHTAVQVAATSPQPQDQSKAISAVDTLFHKVDQKFDPYMQSEIKKAIAVALQEHSGEVVAATIEDLNLKDPSTIKSIKGLFPVICNANKHRGPRKVVDATLLEKRIQIAKCLEKISSNCG
jgi:hypothetical protein